MFSYEVSFSILFKNVKLSVLNFPNVSRNAGKMIVFKNFERVVISYLVAIDMSFSLKVKFVKKMQFD